MKTSAAKATRARSRAHNSSETDCALRLFMWVQELDMQECAYKALCVGTGISIKTFAEIGSKLANLVVAKKVVCIKGLPRIRHSKALKEIQDVFLRLAQEEKISDNYYNRSKCVFWNRSLKYLSSNGISIKKGYFSQWNVIKGKEKEELSFGQINTLTVVEKADCNTSIDEQRKAEKPTVWRELTRKKPTAPYLTNVLTKCKENKRKAKKEKVPASYIENDVEAEYEQILAAYYEFLLEQSPSLSSALKNTGNRLSGPAKSRYCYNFKINR